MTQQSPPYDVEYDPHASFITRHWRGDISLGKSYWLNGVLIGFIGRLIWFGAVAGLAYGTESRSTLVFWLWVMIVVQVTVFIWQAVGIWRSSSKHVSRGGKTFWAVLAKIAIVLGVIYAVSVTLNNVNVVTRIAANSNYWLDPHARTH